MEKNEEIVTEEVNKCNNMRSNRVEIFDINRDEAEILYSLSGDHSPGTFLIRKKTGDEVTYRNVFNFFQYLEMFSNFSSFQFQFRAN